MPFFQPVVHSDILLGCVSLRVQRPKTKNKEKIKIKKSHGKRVYLFTSKGSITVEAAIVITVFVLTVFSMIGYLTMMNKQLACQIRINNVATAISKMKFYETIIDEIHGNNGKTKDLKEEAEQLKNQINLSGEFIQENEWGEVNIAYSFFYKIPWINKKMQITERCFMKDWTGCDITRKQELVYITKTGRVYHLTKECSHLSIHIRKVNYMELTTEKNCYGEKYKKCAICVKQKPSLESDIFVTEDGTKYHNSLMCSGLTRNIITVEKDKVGNMLPCSRCTGE